MSTRQPRRKPYRISADKGGLSPKKVDNSNARELEAEFNQYGHGVELRGHNRLYVRDVMMADDVFQPRFTIHSSTERHGFLAQINDLRNQIRSDANITKDGFDPIVVWPCNSVWYCIEGHARMHAYRAEGWNNRRIAVTVFGGTFLEALLKAGELNAEKKRPMSNAERRAWVWSKIILMGVPGTDKAIARINYVSESTITRMRRVARHGLPRKLHNPLKDSAGTIVGYRPEDLLYTAAEVRTMPWDALIMASQADSKLPDGEVNFFMLEKQSIIATLHRHFPKVPEQPELFASALAAAYPESFTVLLAHLSRHDISSLGDEEKEGQD